jgi:16S rRNA (uracil1498-N3)-methyltransferase
VERDDRTPLATFYAATPFEAGAMATLGDGPSHHARVKRLAAGDRIRLTDGQGHLGTGVIAELRRATLDVAVERVDATARPPALHLRVPVADRERMLWLAEKATELGISTWQAIRFRRSASVSSRGEGVGFEAKLRARMISALEQSSGSWLPDVIPESTLDAIFRAPSDLPLLLDRAGAPMTSVLATATYSAVVVLLGPEGGLEEAETNALARAGWHRARLAATTLRFETAAIAAVAILRALQQRLEV